MEDKSYEDELGPRYKNMNDKVCRKCGNSLENEIWHLHGYTFNHIPTEYLKRCSKCGTDILRPASKSERERGLGGFDPV